MSNGNVKFYYGSDGISWTQLGATQSTTANAMANAAIPLRIGNWADILYFFTGKIYRVTISNSIGGTPVVDFNPASYNAATSQSSWVSASGETWTINVGSAVNGYKGCIVSKSIVMGDGVDDFLTPAAGNTPAVPTTMYCAFRGWKNNGGLVRGVFGSQDANYFIGRYNSNNIATYAGGNTYLNVATSTDTLNLATYVRRNGTNELQVNNGAATSVTENSNTVTSSKVNIFFINAGYDMSIFSVGITTLGADTTTRRTAMYNALRTFDNNAY